MHKNIAEFAGHDNMAAGFVQHDDTNRYVESPDFKALLIEKGVQFVENDWIDLNRYLRTGGM